MKNYMYFLIGLLVALSGNNVTACDAEKENQTKTFGKLTISDGLSKDEKDKLGEKILSGHLGKTDNIEPYLQDIMDWIQESMYGGVCGFYGNNRFLKIVKALEKIEAVKLEFDTATVGKDSKPVEYISKIKTFDSQKVKDFLQKINDRTAEYNKKYPYRED
jgi:hypothetical protein